MWTLIALIALQRHEGDTQAVIWRSCEAVKKNKCLSIEQDCWDSACGEENKALCTILVYTPQPLQSALSAMASVVCFWAPLSASSMKA